MTTVKRIPPLELTTAEMQQAVDLAMKEIIAHIESLPEQPAFDTEGGEELARSLVESPPEEGQPYTELLDLLFGKLVHKTFNTAGPGYLAYIPGGGLFQSAVADLIAGSVNRYVGVWAAAPGLVQLETNVIRWFCQMVGYPEGALGVLTSGGSLANFTAVVTARRRLLPDDFLNGTLYASDQIHHSVAKAAMLAGFPAENLRLVASDDRQRIRVDSLAQKISEDRASGVTPFLIVGSAGTVNTGAVDDLTALATLARSEGLWLHLDGAYGGFFALTERGRRALAGLEQADSITLDPHKGLFLPYGTGCLLVRDRAALREAHHIEADYMPRMQDDPDLVDFCELSPELSRDFRGLRVWLPLKMHGLGTFRAALDEKLDLARWAATELAKIDQIEIVAEPELSIVASAGARRGGPTTRWMG
ncbi:MAG: decarboxylase [Acidobacteria bacterium]|nr:MAG: decarboxylase [Acidobacteriota bacterium]